MYIHNIACHTASFLVTNAKYLTKETGRKYFCQKNYIKSFKKWKITSEQNIPLQKHCQMGDQEEVSF